MGEFRIIRPDLPPVLVVTLQKLVCLAHVKRLWAVVNIDDSLLCQRLAHILAAAGRVQPPAVYPKEGRAVFLSAHLKSSSPF